MGCQVGTCLKCTFPGWPQTCWIGSQTSTAYTEPLPEEALALMTPSHMKDPPPMIFTAALSQPSSACGHLFLCHPIRVSLFMVSSPSPCFSLSWATPLQLSSIRCHVPRLSHQVTPLSQATSRSLDPCLGRVSASLHPNQGSLALDLIPWGVGCLTLKWKIVMPTSSVCSEK